MKKIPESTKENQFRGSQIFEAPNESPRPENTMFETQNTDIVALILKDHKPLKKLIETLKNETLQRRAKEDKLEEFVMLLAAHSKAEEQSLYVYMKESRVLRMQAFEGDTEHAIAEQLIHEINATPDDDEWSAKVKVIAELVENHILEEEKVIFKKVEECLSLTVRQTIGKLYKHIKSELDSLARPSLKASKRINDWQERPLNF